MKLSLHYVLLILASVLIGASSVYQPMLVFLILSCLPLVLLFYNDRSGMTVLKSLLFLTFLIPFQSYSFHLNGKFFLFPPFLLIQFLFIGLLITKKLRQLRFGVIDLLFFIFFISAVISSFQAVENPLWSIRYLYVILFGGYVLFLSLKMVSYRVTNLAKELYPFLNTLVVIAAAYGIIEYFLKLNLLYPHVPFYDLASPGSSITIYRSSATFDHPLTAALVFSLFLPYNLLQFLVNTKKRLPYGIFTALLFIGIQVTGSRVGILYIIIAIMFIIILSVYGKLFKFHVLYLLIAGLIIAIPTVYLMFDSIFARSFSILETGLLNADINRAESILWALRVFSDYWLWGMGPYNSDFLKSYQAMSSGLNISSEWGLENSWISLLLEQGIMGIVLFLLIQIYCIVRLLSHLRSKGVSSHQKVIIVSVIIGFFMLNVSFATRNASHSYMTWIIYFLFIYFSEGISTPSSKPAYKQEESQ